MDRQDELAIIRAAYAKQILALVEIDDRRLDAAFAAIRREDFLGPGPWPILRRLEGRVYVPHPTPIRSISTPTTSSASCLNGISTMGSPRCMRT